jgi:hypothetical protein
MNGYNTECTQQNRDSLCLRVKTTYHKSTPRWAVNGPSDGPNMLSSVVTLWGSINYYMLRCASNHQCIQTPHASDFAYVPITETLPSFKRNIYTCICNIFVHVFVCTQDTTHRGILRCHIVTPLAVMTKWYTAWCRSCVPIFSILGLSRCNFSNFMYIL